VRNERIASLDWSDSGHSDDALTQRIKEGLPKLFSRLNLAAGNAECSVNLAGNRLRGPDAIAMLLRRMREAKVHVTSMRLHKNQLGDEAMQSIADHMRHSGKDGKPLLELHLSDNRLTEVGVRTLLEAAHKCRYYFSANSTPERRCRALWLRCENQWPPINDPQQLLDELTADGLKVCLLPSKEYVPPVGGRARQTQLEAAVHMHHAFAPKSEHRLSTDAWSRERDKGSSGGKGGKDSSWGSDSRKELVRSDSKDSKGKDGKDGKGKGGGWADEGKSRTRSFAHYEEQKGRGKAIAESWRNVENYANKAKRVTGSEEHGSDWKDWGYDDDEWDSVAQADDPQPRRETQRFELGQRGDSFGASRGGDAWESKGMGMRSSSAWASDHRQQAKPPPSPSAGPLGGLPLRAKERNPGTASSSNYQSLPGQDQAAAYGNPSEAAPTGLWESVGSMWMEGATQGVRWKLEACKKFSLLSRSLKPRSTKDADWQTIATLGARNIAQACNHRASVVVGSFVEDAGLYELSSACAGESNLASVFRQLRLGAFLEQGSLQDEESDAQCASCLAAMFGELIDAPAAGESTRKENARKVAEWALLDFIFLVGAGRLLGPCLTGMVNGSGRGSRC